MGMCLFFKIIPFQHSTANQEALVSSCRRPLLPVKQSSVIIKDKSVWAISSTTKNKYSNFLSSAYYHTHTWANSDLKTARGVMSDLVFSVISPEDDARFF